MALLFIDSFDHYQSADLTAKWSNVLFAGITPAVGRCGTQALELGGTAIGFVEKGLLFAGATGVIGFAYKVVQQLFGAQTVAAFRSGSLTQCYLTRQSDGSIAVWHDGGTQILLGASAPDVIRTGEYFYVEFLATIAPVAGVVQVRVNGALVLNLAGVKTQSDFSAATTITSIALFSGASYLGYFDDLYVLDDAGPAPWNTFLGDSRVEYLRPDGNGAHQDWDLIGAATHWQAIDDGATPDGDTSYIHTATLGLTDTETYSNTGLPAGAIYGLQVNLYARKTDGGGRSLAPVIRLGGVDYIGGSQQPSFPSYNYLIQLYSLNPATAAAWTIAAVNAIEVGVTVSA